VGRVLFVNIPAYGHVNPTLPLLVELVARGEQVDYALRGRPLPSGSVSAADFEPAIRQAGATLLPYEGVLPQGRSLRSARSAAFGLPIRLLEETIHVLPQLVDAVGSHPPDYVVHDSLSLAARLLADRLHLPRVQMHCTYAFSEASLQHPAFRRIAPWATAPSSDEFEEVRHEFANRFGVDPPSMRDIFLHAAPLNVVFLPRAFQPGGEGFDERWAFVGPSIGHRGEGQDLSLVSDLDGIGEGPLVLVSLGSVFNEHVSFFRTVLEAFAGTQWRVLLSIGPRLDIHQLGPVPRNAVVRRHVPQIEVLARARAFVSHGGMNSTMESILAEVPLVVVPQMPEQGVTADRVSELGLGTHLNPDQVTASSLLEAVSTVAGDTRVRKRLAAMRQASVEAGGPARAAEQILAHVT
jgi:MGT family glycosyltransferase